MELRQIISELRSRGVYRVAAIYSAGAWALLQVADLVFPIIGLPDWSITAVLIAAALGFPVAMLLSWMFDLTREGLVETVAIPKASALHHWTIPHIIELALIVFLILVVGFLYAERLTVQDVPTTNRTSPVHGRASIAVMPFVNMGDDNRIEYLGDGLAEEVLNLLARLNELDVAARTSSFYFKDRQMDVRQIGKRLGVGYLLEGSVRQDADRVRVTAQLIDVTNGYHIWSETYDQKLESLLDLQDTIAVQVVDQLQLLLSPESRNLLVRSANVDPAAYEYYLQGRAYLRLPGGVENAKSAVSLFEKAIANDADFADAQAGLCDSLLVLYSMDLDEAKFHSAENACQQALVLDRRATSVYVALGNLYRSSGQYQQAINEFNTALSLNPNSADAYLGLANTYRDNNNDDQAEKAYQSAIDLQPNYWKAYIAMGSYLFASGRFNEATPYYRRITELMPDSAASLNNLGASLFLSGNFEEAAHAWKKSLELDASAITYSNVATSFYFMGRYQEAVDLYHKAVELTPEHYEVWGNLGDAYSQISDEIELATPMYKNAIKLAQSRLKVNEEDSNTLSLVGHYLARIGRQELALEYVDRALELSPDDMYVNYVSAIALTTLGNKERALGLLKRSLELGYPWHMVEADASLNTLHNMPGYKRLNMHMD